MGYVLITMHVESVVATILNVCAICTAAQYAKRALIATTFVAESKLKMFVVFAMVMVLPAVGVRN
jgi:hypothetical protein